MTFALLFLTLLPQTPQVAPGASPREVRRLLDAARAAEVAYERAVRRFAPVSAEGLPSGPCTERVGRFCLFFDDPNRPAPPIARPAPEVRAARRAAVGALRRAFAVAPGNRRIADALVRYLAEDDRGREAVSAARAFRWASADSAWSGLLLGFALHAAHEDSAADTVFANALDREPAAQRRRLLDVSWLLDGKERGRYKHLSTAGKRAYERRLWRAADPLYLLPGNPAFAEHISRRVWTVLLPNAPWVRGTTSWGTDLEQLTMRYGVPVSRERVPGTWIEDNRFIERYDPAQLELVPEDLTTGGALEPVTPGAPWPRDPAEPRSGHSPGGLRRLRSLLHQVSRFPVGNVLVVRADGALPLDSAARKGVRTGLFLLSRTSLDIVASARGTARVEGDTARFHLQVAVPAGAYVYSLEAYEPASRLGGRARYDLEPAGDTSRTRLSGEPGAPRLSDIVVASPFRGGLRPTSRDDPALRPLTRLVVAPEDTLGLYAEISAPRSGSPAAYRLDLSMERRGGGGLAGALAWIGRTLRLTHPRPPPRVEWNVAAAPGTRPMPIALDLGLDGVDPGLYAVVLDATALPAGESVRAERLIRIEKRTGH